MPILLFQILAAISLFFIINFIGKHSYTVGYMGISMFMQKEDAPALNFLIRVLTPLIYLIIISAILYYYNLDKFVQNIYLVNVYYILFRLIFNILTNRTLLINWKRQVIYWGFICIGSYFLYEKVIKVKENILPDFTTIANELWIIILLFLFQLLNKLEFSNLTSQKRKSKYIHSRYYYYKNKYGTYIKKSTNNEALEKIAYAIIIYEDFNRPKIVRIIESISFRMLKRRHTLGVMQVSTDKLISDYESVKMGISKIIRDYENFITNYKESNLQYFEYEAKQFIIENYNAGRSYSTEVSELLVSCQVKIVW